MKNQIANRVRFIVEFCAKLTNEMWNFVVRLLTTQQPFRIFKRMAALAAGKASIETVFFGPTSGYGFVDAVCGFLFSFSNVVIRLCFVLGPLVLILYIAIDARTFNEYAEGFYALTTLAVNAGISINIYFKRTSMLEMIDRFEHLIRKRKEKYFYRHLNIKIIEFKWKNGQFKITPFTISSIYRG